MSAINAFLSTWSNARSTYGEGSPQTGDQYDNSATLRSLESNLESAAPGSRWTGTASAAYGTANTEHRRVLGQLAGLDQRLATEVSNSAQVVDTGRRNLDAIRQWVVDAAASVPPGQAGERAKLAIAQKGLAQLAQIVTASNSDSNEIGGRIRALQNEFQALTNQKFAEGGQDGPMFATGEGEEGEEDQHDRETKQWATETVEAALDGDPKAAARVDEVLDSISDAQIAGTEPLDAQQAQVLSQMQAQTHKMSLDELSEVRDRLGDRKGILANSWQLMSDPDVKFPKGGTPTDLFPEITPETVSGGMEQLPQSIQDTLGREASVALPNPEGYPLYDLPTRDELQTIAGFVADGDERFQQGSHLDGGLMSRGAEILQESGRHSNEGDAVVQDIFRSAGRDEFVAHELITGRAGEHDLVTGVKEGQEFLKDMSTHAWEDNGAAARTLTDWIDDAANGTNPQLDRMAGETAYAVADYLGDNGDDLLDMKSGLNDSGLGARNPDLVRGYAEALAPYQEAMIGDHRDPTPGFGLLDGQERGDFSHARNVFAVIDTDAEAAENFNRHAYESILEYQQETADAAASGAPADGTAMGHAGRMLGVLNSAATMAEMDPGFDLRRDALGAAMGQLTGKLPVIGSLGQDYLLDALLGNTPGHQVDTHSFTEVQNMQTWAVASELFGRDVPVIPQVQQFVLPDGTLMSPQYVLQNNPGAIQDYYQALTDYAATGGWGTTLSSFGNEYDEGAGTRR
ncbi:TPR repeat region-containing protein [Mycolicibacterium sp. XJ1819]